jgi:uncharacterized protein YndB with AHSA1/START domain
LATIHLQKTLAAPIDRVFELLTDHAGYTEFRGFSEAGLLQEGPEDRNGVGAIRRLSIRGLRFDEEITAFERPTRMDYLIREVNLPVVHERGTIRLTAQGDATAIDWRSTFSVTTPIVGGALAAVLAVSLKRGFARLLDDIEAAARDAG